jgi:hypothetical protein
MRHVLLAGEPSGLRPCCAGDSMIRRLEDVAEMFL